MFRASSAHLQEVNDINCTCMQPLVFSFSAGDRLVHLLRGIDTNLIHNVYINYTKIKFLYMFRASSAHLQEVNGVNCTRMQPLVFSFSAGGRLVQITLETCRGV
jgi:hypothetical protein